MSWNLQPDGLQAGCSKNRARDLADALGAVPSLGRTETRIATNLNPPIAPTRRVQVGTKHFDRGAQYSAPSGK